MGNMKITREEFFDIIEIYLKDHLIETERGLQGFGSTGKDINAETIDNYIKDNIEESKLINLIDKYSTEKGIKKDSEIYNKARITKQLFYKIRNGMPVNKRTIISIALALELSLSEAEKFLQVGGYSFSPTSEFDLIMQCCFEKGYYDIISIDEVLHKKNIPTFSPA